MQARARRDGQHPRDQPPLRPGLPRVRGDGGLNHLIHFVNSRFVEANPQPALRLQRDLREQLRVGARQILRYADVV